MKKVLCIILALAMALSMSTSLAFASTGYDNCVNYTELDYSAAVTVGGDALTGTLRSTDQSVQTGYWWGNAIGASVTLEAGKAYKFSFTTYNEEGDNAELENEIVVLTGGEFAGSDSNFNTDALTKDVGICKNDIYELKDNDYLTVSTKFVPETSGTYRILAICWMEADEVGYEITAEETEIYTVEISDMEYEWYSEPKYNDYGTIAIGPNGELAVADYDCEEDYDSDSDSDADADADTTYYLRVYNPDGTLKFKVPIQYSDCTPVFDEDGNVYVGTYVDTIYLPDGDSDSDTDSDSFRGSCIYAFDTEGNEIWAKTYINSSGNDYDFWSPLYIVDGVLIARADANLLGIDTATGDTIWEYNLDFDFSNPDSALAVDDKYVYVGLYEDNTIYLYSEIDTDVADTDEPDSDNDNAIYLYNALLKIDAVTGEIVGYIDELDECCGAADSQMVIDDNGFLYFVCDGGAYNPNYDPYDSDSDSEPEYIYQPLYIVNTETLEYNIYDLDLSDADNFMLYYHNGTLYVNDNDCDYDSFCALMVENGEVIYGPFSMNVGDTMLGDADRLMYNGREIDPDVFNYARIYDMAIDNEGSIYFMMRDYNDYDEDLSCFVLRVKRTFVDGLDVRAINPFVYSYEILEISDAYASRFIVTDTHVYIDSCEPEGIYAIRYADDPIVDTDSDTDEIGDDTDTGSGAGGDDTDIGGDTTDAEDTETETETDIDDYLKGDINGDGVVDVIDVALARAHIVGNTTLDEDALKRGDMNDDGVLDIIDVVMIRKVIVEKK